MACRLVKHLFPKIKNQNPFGFSMAFIVGLIEPHTSKIKIKVN